MIDLVQISTILVLFNKIEIINISGDGAQKRQTTFWKSQNKENFVVIVLKIINVKEG